MPQAPLDVLGEELDFLENLRVRLEADERAVRLVRGLALLLVLELALLEGGLDEFAFAKAADKELLRERVDRLGADAVEADAELEDVIVVFGAGVDLGNAIHHFAQRECRARNRAP